MKTIIKEVAEEKALKGYVLTLSNFEKFFVSKAELEGHKPLVTSEIRYLIENTSDGRRFKVCFIDNIRLVRDPDYPFKNFEEAAVYASLPPMLRHITAIIKTQNPDNEDFPAGPIVHLLNAAWQMSKTIKKEDKTDTEFNVTMSLEFAEKYCPQGLEQLAVLLDDLSFGMFRDKNLLNNDSYYLYASCTGGIFEKLDGIKFDLVKYRMLIGAA